MMKDNRGQILVSAYISKNWDLTPVFCFRQASPVRARSFQASRRTLPSCGFYGVSVQLADVIFD